MKCNNCDFESQNNFAFCPQCGAAQGNMPQNEPEMTQAPAPAPEAQIFYTPTPQNTAANTGTVSERILTALKDNLFLTLCILFSVSTAFSIFSGSISVINILFTVFLWLTYSKAYNGIASKEYLRFTSGTVFASYIVNYVIAGALAFVGLLVMIFGASSSGLMAKIMQYISYESGFGYGNLAGGLMTAAAILIGVVFIIAAAAVAVVNFFATHNIHLFTQSVYKSLEKGEPCFVKTNTAQIWLMVLGILSALGAVSSLFSGNLISFIASGSGAAAEIIASIMIKKYFS